MKITCPYCGSLFNDTKEHCPNCGAANSGVVRKSGNQPTTIDELKAWYQSKGLPPYETTRFFIGENYQKPRAFGIYKEEKTGNFVVYKNKGNGQRAIRYEGTDEAYAVNELFQRLKQEILQQKAANAAKGNSAKPAPRKKLPLGCLAALFVAGIPFLLFLIVAVVVLLEDMPKDGYYQYQQTLYYHYDHSQPEAHTDWFWYNSRDWAGPISQEALPQPLEKNKQAKAYYLSDTAPASLAGCGFTESAAYRDASGSDTVDAGYYLYEEITYYHLETDQDTGWYYFDSSQNDWFARSPEDVPQELQSSASAADFFYTPTWDSSTQITDFTDTQIYEDHLQQQAQTESDWEDNDWEDDDYNWDANDSWNSDNSDWDSDW